MINREVSDPLLPAVARLRIGDSQLQGLPRSASQGTQLGQPQFQRNQATSLPTLPSEVENRPVGPRPPGDPSSTDVRRWALLSQQPGREIASYTDDPESLFRLPPGLQVQYPPHVVIRRPDWIVSFRLSENSRIHDYLFPLCSGPRGRNGEYFGIPWHDISLALYDVEGLIMQKEWFFLDAILLLLYFSLSTYEHCVWIYPSAALSGR